MIPASHQAPLPLDRILIPVGAPGAGDRMELDVLIVGAGPAGLSAAIELSRLVKQHGPDGGPSDISIGVLEKAEALGEHSLSGALVNPRAFRELFPDLKDAEFPFRAPVEKDAVYFLTSRGHWRVPTPPTMRSPGCYVASLCEIVQWLGHRAEAAGVDVFTGFPAAALLMEGTRAAGVRTAATGLDRSGAPTASYSAPNDLTAKVVILAEGTRGLLAQAYLQSQGVGAENPQIFALGVKEIWETKRQLDRVIHTLGWPLPTHVFGGSFCYPLEPNLVALGLIVGLDYGSTTLDVHGLLQQMKRHALFRRYLEGGTMVEWGAKTIPEGGYFSLPRRRHGDGVLIVGDAAGFVDVPSLKGIHYAMQSGIYAGRAAYAALKANDTSASCLAEYDRLVDSSYITSDMYRTRNMRLAFKDGLWIGGLKAGLMTLTGGRFPGGKIDVSADVEVPRTPGLRPGSDGQADGQLTFSKVDAVFKSGNVTRDSIPSHLIVGRDVPAEIAEFYAHMCPAAVYERGADGATLRINPPNCVDCKATDVLGPRWTPREGGSGPRYRRM